MTSQQLSRLWKFILDEVPSERGLLVLSDGRGRMLLRLTKGLEGNGDAERCLSVVRRVAEDGQPLCLTSAPAEHFLREDGRMGFVENGSCVCVPLLLPGKAAGALYLDREPRAAPFTPRDLDFLLSLVRPILVCASGGADEAGSGPGARPDRDDEDPVRRIIGRSPAIVRLKDGILKIKDSSAAVLIAGESGTGKELVARAIHESGPRRRGPFLAVNCSAIPDTLLESELFGHNRGAFTGAVRDKPGLIEEADEGTFFLDEVGDLSPLLQAKLLRVIQDKEVRRIGGTSSRRVGVRFISATNKVLRDEVGRGRFREDLYFRLRVIPVDIPPLRERMEDLPPLADHFLRAYCREMNRERSYFSTEALEQMLAYSWPGNIRELQNEIQRCLVFSPGDSCLIPLDSLSASIKGPREEGPAVRRNYFDARAEFERRFLCRALALFDFNRSRTAGEIGLSRQGLFKLLKKHKIDTGGHPLRGGRPEDNGPTDSRRAGP